MTRLFDIKFVRLFFLVFYLLVLCYVVTCEWWVILMFICTSVVGALAGGVISLMTGACVYSLVKEIGFGREMKSFAVILNMFAAFAVSFFLYKTFVHVPKSITDLDTMSLFCAWMTTIVCIWDEQASKEF